jgi:hypothetical protein
MRSEYTRQTRWGHDPEPVDPQRSAPGSAYVRLWIWVPCPHCDLQVHASLARSVSEGVTCPECGARLVSPLEADDSGCEA